ncbi:hypothetical protein ACF0H5_018711 [Mactra antiquata]
MGQTSSTNQNVAYSGVHHHSNTGNISFMNGGNHVNTGRKKGDNNVKTKFDKDKKVKKEKPKEGKKVGEKNLTKSEVCRNVARYGYEDRNVSFMSKLKLNETKPLLSKNDSSTKVVTKVTKTSDNHDGMFKKVTKPSDNVNKTEQKTTNKVDSNGIKQDEVSSTDKLDNKSEEGDKNHNVSNGQLESFNREFEQFVSKVRQEASSSFRSDVSDIEKTELQDSGSDKGQGHH